MGFKLRKVLLSGGCQIFLSVLGMLCKLSTYLGGDPVRAILGVIQFSYLNSNMSLKGTSGWKKVTLKRKSVKNAKKRAITDFNGPNGSRDIPLQSQEFGQDGHRHFVGFQPILT